MLRQAVSRLAPLLQVGLWDASSGTWVTRGITDITVEAGMLSFQARWGPPRCSLPQWLHPC